MATITGTVHELNNPIKVWKNFRLAIEKNIESGVNEFVRHGQEMIETWQRQVRKAVGVQLPDSQWHSRRNPNKLFPYRNTGRQQESITGIVRKKATAAGNFSITAWGEIGVPYASYTNVGKPARHDGATPGWVGWVDDVLYGDGRGGIMSVSDVFEAMSIERVIMKEFEV